MQHDSLDPVVIFDIEATHLKANFGHVLSFGFKVLGGKTKVLSIRDYKLFRKEPWNDSALLSDVNDIMSTAGVWVSYYGTGFDIPFLRARMFKHEIPYMPPVRHVDLYYTARSVLPIHSRRLGVVGGFLGLPAEKTPLAPEIWEMAMAGNKPVNIEALKYIEEHNYWDVELLEQVYMRLLPAIRQHPVRTLLPVGFACNNCGGTKLQRRGKINTRAGVFQQFVCLSRLPNNATCGTWGRVQISS